MKKYLVYDNVKKGDTFVDYFDTEKEALDAGENMWVHLIKSEQEKREEFFVGYCDDYDEEERCSENSNYFVIKDYVPRN